MLISRREGMTREEFLEHWCTDHPAFVRRLPGVVRYRQSPAIEHHKQWPADGLAELWFESLRDVAQAFDTEEAAALFEHEEAFIGQMSWFIAQEIDVPLRTDSNGAQADHLP